MFYHELFFYIKEKCGNMDPSRNNLLEIIAICRRIIETESWTLLIDKEPSLEADILFQTKAGIIHAGRREFITKGNMIRNKSFYIDFRKNKIRHNVVKWKLIQ